MALTMLMLVILTVKKQPIVEVLSQEEVERVEVSDLLDFLLENSNLLILFVFLDRN